MKNSGIVRRIDELGRVVIPKEIRSMLGIHNGDAVEISSDGERVTISKYSAVCHFCGTTDGVIEFKAKRVCRACISELERLG